MAEIDPATYIGLVRAELLFRGCRTLKDRRGHLLSLKDRLRKIGLASAQVGPPDLVQRAWISATCVSGTESEVRRMLDSASRLLESNPEWEPLGILRDIFTAEETETEE